MKLTEVNKEDGIALAMVIRGLTVAKFDGMTGNDVEALYKAKQWLKSLAVQVAGQLSPAAPAASSTEGFKVKSMGPLPGKLKKQKGK